MLEYRKVTRLWIEPRPSGYIPDALTTELSSLVGFNHTMNFMYLPPQVMVTSHPQRTTKSTIDHQGQPDDDSVTTTWVRLNSSDRLHNPSSTVNTPISQLIESNICRTSGWWWRGHCRKRRVRHIVLLYTSYASNIFNVRPLEEELAAHPMVMKLVPNLKKTMKQVDAEPGLLHNFIKMVSNIYALCWTSWQVWST